MPPGLSHKEMVCVTHGTLWRCCLAKCCLHAGRGADRSADRIATLCWGIPGIWGLETREGDVWEGEGLLQGTRTSPQSQIEVFHITCNLILLSGDAGN